MRRVAMTELHRIAASLGRIVALAAIYVVVAKLGLMLDAVMGFATLVWAPTGISLAALLLFGDRLAVGVLLGAFVVNLWSGAPFLVALGIALGNTAEAILGTYAMRRLAGFHGAFDRLRHVMVLLFPVATLSTLVSATVGVTSLNWGGIVAPDKIVETGRAWWVGDILGDLVVAPLLLTWADLRSGKYLPLYASRVSGPLVLRLPGFGHADDAHS